MMRYVAIGAIVGFLVAWFLLSSGPAVVTPPPPPPSAPVLLPPSRPTPDQMRELQRVPEGAKPRAL